MKSYGQFIDKSITLDESIVGRYFDSSRFGPGGNKNVTTGLKPNVPTVRQLQKTKPNNPTKPPLRATSQRPPAGSNAPDLLKNRNPVRAARKVVDAAKKKDTPETRSKIAQFVSNNKVREVGSFLNQARKNLPTSADFAPTSQSGFGVGGSLSGRSLKPFSSGFKNRKKFEPSTTVRRTGLGGDKPREVTFRGREIDPRTGETIEKDRNPTSYRGKVANRIKRGLGIVDIRDKDTKSDEPKGKDKVTMGDAPKNPPKGGGGSKVTTGAGNKKNPPSGGAEASVEAPKPEKKTETTGTSTGIKFPRNIPKKIKKPDTTVRNQEVKTDPNEFNKVKGFPDKPEPKQENIPGIETGKTEKTEKKPRKKRTPEEIAASNKKRAETKAANKKKKDDAIGQGTIPGLENRNQSRTDAAEKSGVKITGDTQPKITGTKKDKVTSSDNVDKTSKPVEKPVEKPKSNEVAITDAREKKTPGKKRGPKKGSTNVRTLARQNREKKQQETQAKERLASAVKDQEQKDKKNPIEQAKQDSKTSTALKGSNLDRNRKELAKMLNLTPSSKSKTSTQIKGISDEDLARSGGSKKNIDDLIIKAKKGEAEEQEKLVKNEIKMQKRFGKPGPQSAARKEIDRLRKKDLVNKMKEKDKKKREKKKEKEEKTKTESFSWREEFIWETDKKYPEKVKEIKPMSGKNTITINPEDETSKYKRGY